MMPNILIDAQAGMCSISDGVLLSFMPPIFSDSCVYENTFGIFSSYTTFLRYQQPFLSPAGVFTIIITTTNDHEHERRFHIISFLCYWMGAHAEGRQRRFTSNVVRDNVFTSTIHLLIYSSNSEEAANKRKKKNGRVGE